MAYFYYFFHIAMLALSVHVYRFYSKYFESTPCSQDPIIELLDGTSFDSCSVFSTDYFQARQKFRTAVANYNASAASASAAELWSSTIIDDLTLDVAVLPGKTRELGTIVHSSGVHGIEGYAGSAIQLALLDMFSKEQPQNVDRPTIVLVHAVNPVGMKEYRRCNEHNVDLNRNGIAIPGQTPSFQEFVSKRDPNLAGYETLKHIFVPVMDIDRPGENLSWYHRTIGYFVALFPALMEHGFPTLKKGIVAGQYHHPEGLNYGGKEFETSIRIIFDTFVKERPEFFTDSPQVVWLDVHTGLGPFGEDTVLRQAQVDFAKTNNDFIDSYFTTAFSVTSTQDGGPTTADAFKGYDSSKGLLTGFMGAAYRKTILEDEEASTQSRTGIFILQEFGTIPAILVGRALIYDNMLYQFRKNKHARKLLEGSKEPFVYKSPLLGDAFYPQSTTWRRSIIQRGIALVQQSIEYIVAQRAAKL